MFCCLHNAIQLLFAPLVLKENKARLCRVLALGAEGREPFACRPHLPAAGPTAPLAPGFDAKNKQSQGDGKLSPPCSPLHPNSGAGSQSSSAAHSCSFPCTGHAGTQIVQLLLILFYISCCLPQGLLCCPYAHGHGLWVPLGVAGCCWVLWDAEPGSTAPGVPGSSGHAVTVSRELLWGRQPAHRWRGKLGQVSGLKSLDGVPFMVDFS